MAYTTSSALLDCLVEHAVSCLFVNLGSDHPALVEAIAEARATGRKIPQVVTCPNEMVGMSAAHGHWLVSGVPQAVIVHVECGTQALAGAVHNAAKGRAPMLIFAGASPYTQHDELAGSRNEFIQWIQDVHDQRGLVRGYMRYDNELRTGRNVKDLINRAFQFAESDPKGPVYLMGAREVMEEEVTPTADSARLWRPIEPGGLNADAIETIGRALMEARSPLIVTSYAGRNPNAVAPLVKLAELLGIGVLESVPSAMNFPHTNVLYRGNQWNEPVQNAALADADVILIVDSDVPWIPKVSRPAENARIFHIDVDPLKEQMPLWRIASEGSWRCDASTALGQLVQWCSAQPVDAKVVSSRIARHNAAHQRRSEELARLEQAAPGKLTAEYAVGRFRDLVTEDMVILNESISNYPVVFNHLALDRAGSIHASGGGSLGWSGGAAVGAKLARPNSTIVAFAGDGTFMFSVPSSVFWMARRYDAPFLQVIFNNRGWKSPKLSALAVHGSGAAAQASTLDTSFDPAPDYVGIAAAAGGAWGRQVRTREELDETYREALRVVREERRSAVIDLWLDHH